MIKVGDIININGDDGIVKEINKYMIVLESGLCYTHEEVYSQLYEQEKNRADELEKRWKKLKNHFIRQKDKPYSLLHWSKCNGILELMEELEVDDE